MPSLVMRIVYFGNGPVALDVLRFLKAEGEEVAALVLHDEGQRRLGDELIAESGLPPELVFSGSDLREPETVGKLMSLGADIGFSALFGVILKPPVLELFPRGVVNVHPGYLPFNRGRNAQIWSIIDGSPVGATLHYMDDGVDTGPMVERLQVTVEPWDTGESLRVKLEQVCVEVTRAGWAAVRSGKPTMAQDASEGTLHRVRDVDAIAEIDLDATYRAGDLIDLLRALSSPPQSRGAYFESASGKVWVSVSLEPESGSGAS
jgi:methionyl-tRNA formyltransferase